MNKNNYNIAPIILLEQIVYTFLFSRGPTILLYTLKSTSNILSQRLVLNTCDLIKQKESHWPWSKMCCDLVESVGSGEHCLWDTSRKRNEFLLFSIVLRILQLLITLEPLAQVEFSAKCTSQDKHFNQIENWKCHMFEFWLISLDRITNEF